MKKYLLIFLCLLISNLLFSQEFIETIFDQKLHHVITSVHLSEISIIEQEELLISNRTISTNNELLQGKKSKIKNVSFSEGQRKDHRFGLNINLGGPSLFPSISADYFISPKFNIEVGGIPPIPSLFTDALIIYGGLKYHLYGIDEDKKWIPYLGIYASRIDDIFESWKEETGAYIPVGMIYMNNKGFTFGLELAGIIFKSFNENVWGAIKLGHHF